MSTPAPAAPSFELVPGTRVGGGAPLVLFIGPCVLESRAFAIDVAREVAQIAARVGAPLVFKASFDKANRTSQRSFRGPGLRDGLDILREVRDETGLPLLTDVHGPDQAAEAAEVVDVLQIPAFLCRQTDLLLAAAATGKPVNVKKGQFLSPWEMANVADKITRSGNPRVLLCERGTSFGYNNLVVDMRGLAVMRGLGHPVVFDATHSVQRPGGQGDASGGDREFIAPLARAAAAVGIDALFLETHPDPTHALSDGPNAVRLDTLEALLREVLAIDCARRSSTGATTS
jgi:2-dehydro-3-deoxyphosphooctonate aldolase (KDO 8-P synthase)